LPQGAEPCREKALYQYNHLAIGTPRLRLWQQRAASRRIFEMWLACWSMDEIAEQENVGKATVSEICSEFADLQKANKSDRAAAEHATDFPPS
jgi:hypothetical protein